MYEEIIYTVITHSAPVGVVVLLGAALKERVVKIWENREKWKANLELSNKYKGKRLTLAMKYVGENAEREFSVLGRKVQGVQIGDTSGGGDEPPPDKN